MMHAVFGNSVSVFPEVAQNRTSSTLHIKVNLALLEIRSDFLSSFISVTCEIHITWNDKTGLQCKPWSPPNLSSLKLCGMLYNGIENRWQKAVQTCYMVI